MPLSPAAEARPNCVSGLGRCVIRHEPLHAPLNYSAFVEDIEPAAYCYSGSLTTPPCAAASWCVAVARTPVNTEQLAAFAYRIGNAPTNRPLQPLNGRTVVRYSLPPGAVAAPP